MTTVARDPSCSVPLPVRTALYRHFNQAGQLLYVGISLSAVQRLTEHKHTSHWFAQIARVDVEWLPSRREALAAEAKAIAEEAPLCNRWRPRAHVLPPAPELKTTSGNGVRHIASGRIDGWYMRDADHMLGWWRAVFPLDRFELCAPEPGHDNYLHEHRKLCWLKHEDWARSAPDLAAGERYDAKAA